MSCSIPPASSKLLTATASTTDTPSPSMIEAKRMVSSCTRCDAPSILRIVGQRDM